MKPSIAKKMWPLVAVLCLSVGCGSGGSMGADAGASAGGAQQQQDYGATKQMVIDILHSSEGRTAVGELLKDPSVRQDMAVSQQDMSKAIEKMLKNKKEKSFLTEQVKDPTFAAALAKAVQPELTQLLKQLMKDPDYQKDMMVLLKSPDFTKSVQELLKTPDFRGQIQKVMTESLQTPTFRMQFQDALKKAVAESMGEQQGQQGKSGGSSGGSQGGSSDSGGGGGSSESSGGSGGGSQ